MKSAENGEWRQLMISRDWVIRNKYKIPKQILQPIGYVLIFILIFGKLKQAKLFTKIEVIQLCCLLEQQQWQEQQNEMNCKIKELMERVRSKSKPRGRLSLKLNHRVSGRWLKLRSKRQESPYFNITWFPNRNTI